MSETHTPNDKYDNFVNGHLEALAECIPTKQRPKPRVTWETLGLEKTDRRENRFQMLSEEPTQYQCPKTLEGTK